jgi:hypothetical protein
MEHILIHLVSALVRWLTTSQKPEDEEQTTYQGRPGPYPYTPAPPRPQYPGATPPVYEPNYSYPEGASMSDVEDYLRRVRGQQGAPPPVRVPPRQLSVPDVEILDEPPTGRGVAQHVLQHQFAERAAHLADEVAGVDDQMDQRLHQKFDHRLGRLTGSEAYKVEETRTDSQKPPPAAVDGPSAPAITALDLIALLRSPQSIRHALIMSEIMKPASDRTEW